MKVGPGTGTWLTLHTCADQKSLSTRDEKKKKKKKEGSPPRDSRFLSQVSGL